MFSKSNNFSFNFIAFFNKNRDFNFGAGFNSGGLEDIGGGIAFKTWFSVSNFKFHFNRELQINNFPALMWEGLPFTAKGLLLLKSSFSEISKSHPISLEMVTDLEYPLFLGKYFYQSTKKILQTIPGILGDNFILTKWNLEAVVAAAQRSHISVLPLDPSGTLNPLKAENRLLMMWRIGLPTLASPSLAYLRVMRDTQIEGICRDSGEWQAKIMELMESVELREESVEKGQQYIRDTHSEKIVLEAWDRLIESVL